MKVTLQMIYDRLSDPSAVLLLQNPARGWYQVGSVSETFDFSAPVLAVGTKASFPKDLSGQSLICLGTPSEELMEKNDILYFPKPRKMEKVLSEVQNIFSFYQQWSDDLSMALEKDNSLELIFQIAGRVFDNPIFLHDRNFYRLAAANDPPNEGIWEKDPSRDYYVISMDVLNAFKVEPAYLATMSTRNASLYPADTFGYRVLYCNLWQNVWYQGRICILEINRPFKQSDYQLLNYFSHIVRESFKTAAPREDGQMLALSHFLSGLIENQEYDRTAADTILIHYSWAPFDSYCVACFIMNERDNRTNSVEYQKSRLQQLVPYSCVFVYEEEIIMLVNMTLGEMSLRDLRRKLVMPVREGLMKVGISEEMTDISLFCSYFLQAKAAYKIGNRLQEAFWIYSFEDYKNEYLMQNACGGIQPYLLIHESIRKLMAYDEKGTAELSHTLKTWLENERSILLTASELGIHRTTLLYRIKRIRELTGLNLENKDVRFQLLMSFRLLSSER